MSELPSFDTLKNKFLKFIEDALQDETLINEKKAKRDWKSDLQLLRDIDCPVKCFTHITMMESYSGSIPKFIEDNYAVSLQKHHKKKIKKYLILLRVIVRKKI